MLCSEQFTPTEPSFQPWISVSYYWKNKQTNIKTTVLSHLILEVTLRYGNYAVHLRCSLGAYCWHTPMSVHKMGWLLLKRCLGPVRWLRGLRCLLSKPDVPSSTLKSYSRRSLPKLSSDFHVPGAPPPTLTHTNAFGGHGSTCLHSQHSGGWDRKIWVQRPAWVTKRQELLSQKKKIK